MSDPDDIDDLANEIVVMQLAEYIAIQAGKTRLDWEEYIEEAGGLRDYLYVIGYRLVGKGGDSERIDS